MARGMWSTPKFPAEKVLVESMALGFLKCRYSSGHDVARGGWRSRRRINGVALRPARGRVESCPVVSTNACWDGYTWTHPSVSNGDMDGRDTQSSGIRGEGPEEFHFPPLLPLRGISEQRQSVFSRPWFAEERKRKKVCL